MVIVFNVPDEDILDRALGRRQNPLTGKGIHLAVTTNLDASPEQLEKFDFANLSSVIDSNYDEPQIRSRLAFWETNSPAVLAYFKHRSEVRIIDAQQTFDGTVHDLERSLLWASGELLREVLAAEDAHRKENMILNASVAEVSDELGSAQEKSVRSASACVRRSWP